MAADYTNSNSNVYKFRFIGVKYKNVKFKRLGFIIYEDGFGSMYCCPNMKGQKTTLMDLNWIRLLCFYYQQYLLHSFIL